MGGAAGYFPIVKERVRGRQFNSLFLFVTSRCNSLCRTCFYFDKLNSKDDLTMEEIGRISESSPTFRKLWLSGGEPFLREGLADIVAMFVRRNGVRNVNLPTNSRRRTIRFAASRTTSREPWRRCAKRRRGIAASNVCGVTC
jgi:molybdenum cofactor biosynthesis enzyme MoaA